MPAPSRIKLRRQSKTLELAFGGETFELEWELLRAYSPSAEVRGHGPGQEVLQTGKRGVAVTEVKPVGNYAVQLVFDDGHDTGIYSWDYLHDLCRSRESRWSDYLRKLQEAGASRDPDVQVVRLEM